MLYSKRFAENIHLINRAGFGPSPDSIYGQLSLSNADLVDYFFEKSLQQSQLRLFPMIDFQIIVTGQKEKIN